MMRDSLDAAIACSIRTFAAEGQSDAMHLALDVRRAFDGLRDDLAIHPAPAWLSMATDGRDLMRLVCARISDRLLAQGRIADKVGAEAAAREAVRQLLDEMRHDLSGLSSTLEAMRRHATAIDGAASRMSASPLMTELSPGLGRHVAACVLDRLSDYALVLSDHASSRSSDVGERLLMAILSEGTNVVSRSDVVPLRLDARADRRGVHLASHLMERALALSAIAMAIEPPPLMTTATRIAAAALMRCADLEIRLRARMMVLTRLE